jgi:hypothetical protein
MAQDEPRAEKIGRNDDGTWTLVAVLGIVLLVVYPLSIGPVGWLIIRAGSPPWTQAAFEWIYGPLIWLQDHGPAPASRLLTWYFGWWWH